jgi:hypothetical protein
VGMFMMMFVFIMIVAVMIVFVFMVMIAFVFVVMMIVAVMTMFVFVIMIMMMTVIMFQVFLARIHNGAGAGDSVPFFPAEFQFPAFKAEFVKFAHKRGRVRPRVNKGAKGHVA